MNRTARYRVSLMLPAAVLLGACATRPPDALALLAQADAAYEAGRLQEAEEAYREVTRRVPTDAYAYFRLGNTLAKQTRLDEAAAAYREALIRDPQLPKVYHNLAFVRLLQAEFALEDALTRYQPEDPHRAQASQLYQALKKLTRPELEEVRTSPAAAPSPRKPRPPRTPSREGSGRQKDPATP